MTKKILFGKEARDKILAGVKKITDAVKVTMGAQGKCVLIGEAIYGNDGMIPLPTFITKDGYNTTKHFSLEDPLENRGALLIKEAAFKTVEQAGDATTCTCVLAEAIISEGMKLIDEGANSQELRKGIDIGVEKVVATLKQISIPIDSNEKIFQIATVSANNDKAIGKIIADAFKKIGNDGVIDIQASNTTETELKTSDGFKIERGWLTPFFVNNKAKQITEFENPFILLYDKRITHHTQVQHILSQIIPTERPVLIICEDADEEGLAFLAMNNVTPPQNNSRGLVGRLCIIKAPFGCNAFRDMEDMALLTGATLFSDRKGTDIKKAIINQLGEAKKVIVRKDETVIVEGKSDNVGLDKLMASLKQNLKDAKTEDEKGEIERRIATLTGSIAVIKVGATTETELREKLDRYDDAVRSVKSAVSEGYVAGGGTAFLRISNELSAIDSGNKGSLIVYNSLKIPLMQMAINAGKNSESIYEIVSQNDGNFGYNILTDKIEDMVKSGIIDSTKALRCALQNAASVAGMALITECIIETTY